MRINKILNSLWSCNSYKNNAEYKTESNNMRFVEFNLWSRENDQKIRYEYIIIDDE